MSDLFALQPEAPLAERLRPHSLDDVIGQQHLIGEGKPLRVGAAGRRQNHAGTDFGAEFQCAVSACFRRIFRCERHTRGY